MMMQVGLQLWAGVLSGTCGYTDPGTGEWRWSDMLLKCALPCSEFPAADCTPTFGDACGKGFQRVTPVNDSDPTVAEVTMSCRRYLNPDFGQTNFDHFGYAMLSSFWAYTTEGWSSVASDLGHTW